MSRDNFPDEVFKHLPYMKEIFTHFSDRPHTRDILLLSMISTISGCIPTYCVDYFDKRYSPHLYCFVIGPSASGKGVLTWAKKIGIGVHQHLIETSKAKYESYQIELKKYHLSNNKDGVEPTKPPSQCLFVPANTSIAAFHFQMMENSGNAIMFEHEADTLFESLDRKWGNISDTLRLSFEHETVSQKRKAIEDSFEVMRPTLAVILSGTPGQFIKLIPNAENGLFSRFMYYIFRQKPKWRDPFSNINYDLLEQSFQQLSNVVLKIYKYQQQKGELVKFEYTEKQRIIFNKFFDENTQRFYQEKGEDSTASIFRFGLILTRISMVIQYLFDFEGGNINEVIYCSEMAFQITMEIANTLCVHIDKALDLVKKHGRKVNLNKNQRKLLNALPTEFTWAQYEKIAQELGIAKGTCENYRTVFLRESLIDSISHGHYIKLE